MTSEKGTIPAVLFDMEFEDWMPGTSVSPDAVLHKPQELSPEAQAQARENIGAMAKGRQKSLLINSTDSEAADVTLETTLRHNGKVAFEFYSGSNAAGNEHSTVLGGLADGEADTDAATVGQVKDMLQKSGSGSGGRSYYSTTREEVGKSHNDINAEYIWGLYDALIAKYPDNVQKKEHTNDDGTFTNYEYVISTGEYSTNGSYGMKYDSDTHIKKTKFLVLNSIHGTERKTSISTYRFIRDVLSGHNVPQSFREGSIICVMPVGNPSGFDAFTRPNDTPVDINRNFDWNWIASEPSQGLDYTYGESAASEKETQAIVNWLKSNKDADLFIDFHNNGALNENVVIMGSPDNSVVDTAKEVAMRGVDKIIPFWRDVIKYPEKVEVQWPNGVLEKLNVIFSYSVSVPGDGIAFAYAQNVLGICSLVLETAVYYGDYSDYKKDEIDATEDYTYQAEPIAMGAEALGNILIEFYAQSCEVTQMADIDSKMDMLLQQCHSGFRMESDTITLGKDIMPESGATSFVFKIPCSNGAKMLEFYADSDTLAAIKKTSGTQYIASVLGNCFAEGIVDGSGRQCGYLSIMGITTYNNTDYWLLQDRSIRIDNTNGITFNVTALKDGTYHWKAYYWNDKEE